VVQCPFSVEHVPVESGNLSTLIRSYNT
jgi:hypothetical protein